MAAGYKTGGRQKGTPNKVTNASRAFLRSFIDATEEEALNLWREIEEPATRFKLWLQAAEFAYPKLGRTEVTGEDGSPLQVIVKTYGKDEA